MINLINEINFDPKKVYLVGGGSGDIKNLTLEGYAILSQAEIVLHDMFMEDMKPYFPNSEWIHIGKQKGLHTKKQSEINEMLVSYFKSGKKTVRLKAGDINFYARSSEEIEILDANNIEIGLIPGVSSPQLLGIALKDSLTHRDKTRSISYWSGYWDQEIDPSSIPPTGAHIIFMGHSKVNEWIQKLISIGKSLETSFIAASHLGRSKQKILKTTLGNAKVDLENSSLENPVLIAIGIDHCK